MANIDNERNAINAAFPIVSYKLTKPLLRTPEEGADTIVWLAAAPEAGKTSGRFWLDREPHITSVLPGTYSSKTQQHRLYQKLCELSGEDDLN